MAGSGTSACIVKLNRDSEHPDSGIPGHHQLNRDIFPDKLGHLVGQT